MNNEEEELIRQLAECQKEKEEYLNGWKRAKADFINYKKEQEKLKDEVGKFLLASSILEILKVEDSFEEAFRQEPEDLKKNDWVGGIKKIQEQLNQFLKNYGVEEIKSMGEKFNPEFHESLGEIDSEREEGLVLEEIQKGYKLFGRVLRSAKVKISAKSGKLKEN